MDFETFVQLISNQLIEDNEARREAEHQYIIFLKTNVSETIELLIQVLLSDCEKKIKILCLIHLLHIYRIGPTLPDLTNQLVCENLLGFFSIKDFGENEMPNVTYTVAFIGSFYLFRDIYINLPNQIIELCSDLSNPLVIYYMDCLHQIITRLPDKEPQYTKEGILQLITSCLQDGIDASIMIQAIKILFALVKNQSIGLDPTLMEIAPFIPNMISNFNGDNLYQLLSDLNLFVTIYSSFFGNCMEQMMESLLNVAVILNLNTKYTNVPK